MTEIASLVVEVDSTPVQTLTKALEELTAAGPPTEAQMQRVETVSKNLAIQMDRARVATQNKGMAESAAATQAQRLAESAALQEKNIQRLLDRYDPMGAKLRSLTAEMDLMRKSLGDSVRPDVMKAFEGLEADIVKVSTAMVKAEQTTAEAGKSMSVFSTVTARARMDLMQLVGALTRGDFGMAGRQLFQIATHSWEMVRAFAALAGPVIAATAALGYLVKREVDVEMFNRALNRTQSLLAGVGKAGTLSNAELGVYIDQLKLAGSVSEEAALKIISSFGRQAAIGKQTMGELIGMVPDFAQAMGVDAPIAAEKLAKAFGDPLTQVLALDREMNILTLDQYKQVEAMIKVGDSSGVTKIALTALHERIDGLRNEALTPLQRAWADLMKEFSDTPGKTRTSSDAMDTLAKNLGLMRDVVRGLKDLWGEFMKVLEENTPKLFKIAATVAPLATAVGVALGRGVSGLTGGSSSTADTSADSARAAAARQREAERLAEEAARKERERKLKEELDRRREAERKAAEERKRLLALDSAGWVKYIEQQIKEYEDGLREEAKLTADFYKEKDRLQKLDDAGWVKKIEADIKEYEDGLRQQAKDTAEYYRQIDREAERSAAERLRQEMAVWDQLGNMVGSFFSDLVMNGRSAFDNLRQMLKQFLAEMLALFAKKWVLQMVAGMTGSAGLAAQAAGIGEGSIAGSLMNWGSSALGLTGVAGAFGSGFMGGWGAGGALAAAEAAGTVSTVAGVGVGAPGAAGMASSFGQALGTALGSIPGWGWAIMAVIAIAAWLGGRGGGPKYGGSYTGSFNAAGTMTDATDPAGRLMTPNQADAQMREFSQQWGQGVYDTIRRFGGTTRGFSSTFAFDTDPQGTAQNRVVSRLRDAEGNIVYQGMSEGGRDEEDMQRLLARESARMFVAALRSSELPEAVSRVLSTIDLNTAEIEDIEPLIELAAAFADVLAVTERINVDNILEIAGRNAMEQFSAMGTSLRTLMNNTKPTAESLNTLTQATGQFRQAAAQLIAQIEQLKISIRDMFGQTRANMVLSTMTPQQQYDWYQSEAQRLRAEALASNDPALIQRNAGLVNQYIQAAWNLIPEEQRASKLPEFLAGLDGFNTEIQTHLTSLQNTIARDTNTILSDIEAAVNRLAVDFQTAANTQTAAADKQLLAANTQFEAATTPQQISLNLTGGYATANEGG